MCNEDLKNDAEAPQAGEEIKFSGDLPALFPFVDAVLPDFLNYLVEDVCGVETNISLPIPPNHREIFGEMPVQKVRKPHQAGRDKSLGGFIWVDTDPVAILFNKYILQSCHTLDNDYQECTGNFNYVFCPWFSNIFAGRVHPINTRIAKSPVTGDGVTFKHFPGWAGTEEHWEVSHREFQAVASLFLTRSAETNQPYLLLGRLFDSCNENPWNYSILLYAKAQAERLGIGLAVGQSWMDWYKNQPDQSPLKGELVALFFGQEIQYYQTPEMSLEYAHGMMLSGYGINDKGDDAFAFRGVEGGNAILCGGAYEIIAPSDEEWAEQQSDDWAKSGLLPSTRLYDFEYIELVNECEECCNCQQPVSDNYSRKSEYGDVYCEDCYNSIYTTCDNCMEETRHVDLASVPSSNREWCQWCAEANLTRCENCGDFCELEDMQDVVVNQSEEYFKVDGSPGDRRIHNIYCAACADEKAQECPECGELFLASDSNPYWKNGDKVWSVGAPPKKLIRCSECYAALLWEQADDDDDVKEEEDARNGQAIPNAA